MKQKLFIDGDGVVADFDHLAQKIFGMPAHAYEEIHGEESMWSMLEAHPNFFGSLPLMPDAMILYEGIKHLDPTFLTGIRDHWCTPQKIGWFGEKFPGVPVITCKSREKFKHMSGPGDFLVDDFTKHRHIWEGAGGTFILHTSAVDSLKQLRAAGVDVKIPNLD